MLTGTVLALVRVPVVGARVHALVLVRGKQLVAVRHAHAAADNLADARHQHVDTLGEGLVARHALHVEGLDLAREAVEQDGHVELVGHLALRGLGNVVAHLVRLALLVEDVVVVEVLDRVLVVEPHKRPLGRREARVQLLHQRAGLRVRQHPVHGRSDDLLQVGEQVVKRDERQLHLQVRVLGQVAPGVALLRTEALLDAEHVAQGRQARLQVQLRALGEERLLPVVVELEQGAAALHLGLHHARRRHLEDAHLGKLLTERLEHRSAHLEHGRGHLATQHQVPVVRQERRVHVL